MNNGYLRTVDVAAALRAAAAVLARKGTMAEAIEEAATALEQSLGTEPGGAQVRRSEKALGDVVIGSVCVHDWKLRDQESYQRYCRKCGERHEEDCPALIGGKCSCSKESNPQ